MGARVHAKSQRDCVERAFCAPIDLGNKYVHCIYKYLTNTFVAPVPLYFQVSEIVSQTYLQDACSTLIVWS